MQRPNLFTDAPSELAQDAVLAWLLRWADPQYLPLDAGLHKTGAALLRDCLKAAKASIEVINEVEVHRQSGRIDILVTVNGQTKLIIEDKRGAGLHGDQLERYRAQLLQEGIDQQDIHCLYVQSGNQGDLTNVRKARYEVLSRQDLIRVLRENEGEANGVVSEFLDWLDRVEDATQAYAFKSVDQWDWYEWQGFYTWLQHQLPGSEWKYVNNVRGGFQALYWYAGPVDNAYLQLEHGRLCFKLGGGALRSEAEAWSKSFIAAGQSLSLAVHRPRVMRCGESTTVGVVDDYRSVDATGTIDLSATLNTLRAAEKVLVTARHERNT